MQSIEQQVEQLSQYFTPVIYLIAISAIILETFVLVYQRRPRDKKARWVSIGCGAMSFGLGYLFYIAVTFKAHSFLYQYRIFELGFAWYAWVLCFLVNDMMFYVSHYLQHKVRLLWCVHTVHHSAKQFEFTTGIRGSAFDALVTFPFYVWLPLIGIHPLIFPLMDSSFKLIGFLYHTEFVNKMGFLDNVLVTPSNHRVHHGKDIKYLDKNYSGFFIVWDKLFGTYEAETKRPEYGIRKELSSYSLAKTQLHEFKDLWEDIKSANNWADKMKYIIMPPGWTHDGQGKTVAQLQNAV